MPGFREYRAGDQHISARDMNAVFGDSARRQSALGAVGANAVDVAGGTVGGLNANELLIVRVGTAGVISEGVAKYPWEQVIRYASRGYDTMPDSRYGTVESFPLVEPNGDTSLTPGLKVVARVADDQESLEVVAIVGAGEVAVVIAGYVTFQDPACGSGSGVAVDCGSGPASGDQCDPIYHHANLQQKICGTWCDIGCVWVIDVLGRRLETGRRYKASRIGSAPSGLEAVIIDPSSGACTPSADLYLVDKGNPTYTIVVGDRIGRLCDSGSGASISQGLGSLSANPVWFHGTAYGWSEVACGNVALEDLIIADPRGCSLNTGDVVAGHFNRMIPNDVIAGISGSGETSGCTPSYLAITQPKTGVYRVECCPGGGFRIYTYSGNCGGVGVTNCGCTGGSDSGSGQLFCGQEAVPNQYEFDLTVGTDTCLTCSDWNGHHVLTFDGSATWTKNIILSCTGPPLLNVTAFTLTCADPYMVLDIGGATYRLLKASWNWFGSNVMAQFGIPVAGCNWPASITVSAV